MNILVVGGAGYIGAALSRRLWEAGHNVTVFDVLLFGDASLRELNGRPRFKLIRGDIRDPSQLASAASRQDAVCLLAAIVGEPACNRDPDTAVETNLTGALSVLQASREAGVRRFVFASTCSNYGVTGPDALVTETAPLKPLSTYAHTKVTAEREILAAAGKDFFPTVLRFSTAFGVSPRMRFDLLVSDFTLAAHREGKIVIYGEQFWRPFVHVEDISTAMKTVLAADPSLVAGEVFNVGDNAANIRKIELGRRIQRHVPGVELEIVTRDTDPRSYRVDFSKIHKRLGFKARWSIDDGIEELRGPGRESLARLRRLTVLQLVERRCPTHYPTHSVALRGPTLYKTGVGLAPRCFLVRRPTTAVGSCGTMTALTPRSWRHSG